MIELRFEVVLQAPERERSDTAAQRAVQRFLLRLAGELMQAASRLNNYDEPDHG